jgi:anti-anti-sigma factor
MEIRTDGSTLVLSGDLDVRTTGELRTAVYRMIGRHDLVVVDCSAVTSIDLVALRVLAVATRAAARRGRHVRLRACGPAVRRFLAVSRLRPVLELERVPAA